jgi:hypothetical protein
MAHLGTSGALRGTGRASLEGLDVTDEDEEDEDWTEETGTHRDRDRHQQRPPSPFHASESAAAAAGARFSSLRDLALSNELFDVDGYVCYFIQRGGGARAVGSCDRPSAPPSLAAQCGERQRA